MQTGYEDPLRERERPDGWVGQAGREEDGVERAEEQLGLRQRRVRAFSSWTIGIGLGLVFDGGAERQRDQRPVQMGDECGEVDIECFACE